MNKLTVFTDGGVSGGNKEDQPCYCSYVVYDEDGYHYASESCIDKGTSNQAEYKGMILALQSIPAVLKYQYESEKEQSTMGYKEDFENTHFKVELKSDSKIMVNQINGTYKTKDPKLVLAKAEVTKRIDNLKSKWPNLTLTFTHVKRELNPVTDLLCNLAKQNIIKTSPYQTLKDFKQQHKLDKYKALKEV